jgi:hypothetical protein
LQSLATQACNHIPNNQFSFFQPHRQSQVLFLFATAHSPGCNHARQIVAIAHLLSFFFFFICSHRNKPEDFAIKQFRFLQSRTTQDCKHIPNNQLAFFKHTDKQSVVAKQTYVSFFCNHNIKPVRCNN